jgi:mRNA interferase YafQ
VTGAIGPGTRRVQGSKPLCYFPFKLALIEFVGGWPKHRDLDNVLPALIALLATDIALPQKYVDDPLRGQWKDFRDCHVKPDSVLIYRKLRSDVLQLVRLGSHSELGF